jgi:hypothetical protein
MRHNYYEFICLCFLWQFNKLEDQWLQWRENRNRSMNLFYRTPREEPQFDCIAKEQSSSVQRIEFAPFIDRGREHSALTHYTQKRKPGLRRIHCACGLLRAIAWTRISRRRLAGSRICPQKTAGRCGGVVGTRSRPIWNLNCTTANDWRYSVSAFTIYLITMLKDDCLVIMYRKRREMDRS